MNYTPDWLRPIDNHYLTVSRQRILDMPKRLAGHLGYTQSISALGGTESSQPREYLRVLMEEGGGEGGVRPAKVMRGGGGGRGRSQEAAAI